MVYLFLPYRMLLDQSRPDSNIAIRAHQLFGWSVRGDREACTYLSRSERADLYRKDPL